VVIRACAARPNAELSYRSPADQFGCALIRTPEQIRWNESLGGLQAYGLSPLILRSAPHYGPTLRLFSIHLKKSVASFLDLTYLLCRYKIDKKEETCMRTKVQKWGNSLAIRIPKLFAQNIRLRNNDSVELLLKKGKLIISPITDKEYTLEELLSGVTVDNVHNEIDMGKPVGKEVW
jgi:antitoxin MazE